MSEIKRSEIQVSARLSLSYKTACDDKKRKQNIPDCVLQKNCHVMPNVITEFVRTYFLFGSKYDFLVFSIEKIENININININF